MSDIKRTERGWAGHFICADRCLFHRNTLLEYKDIKIVVSTVGLMVNIHSKDYPNKIEFEPIGAFNRYYETMAFHSKNDDARYNDADVTKQISFNSKWSLDFLDADDFANKMHEDVVTEISNELLSGNKYIIKEAGE
jgi:hypothetical protein